MTARDDCVRELVNVFSVSRSHHGVRILGLQRPEHASLTREEVMNLVAWLIVVADLNPEDVADAVDEADEQRSRWRGILSR